MKKDDFPQITLEDDEPMFTLDQIVGWVRNALAGVGIVACIIAIGFLSAR